MYSKISQFFDLANDTTEDMVLWLCSFLESNNTEFYTHPLGFIQAKFVENTTEFRLNIWGSQMGRRKIPNWPIHTHRFDFESKVLAGQLSDTRLEVFPNEDGSLVAYAVSYEPKGSFLRPVDTSRRMVKKIAKEIYSAGEHYSMSSADFHSSSSNTRLCITLMKLGRQANSPALVIGDKLPRSEVLEYKPIKLPGDQILSELRNGISSGFFANPAPR